MDLPLQRYSYIYSYSYYTIAFHYLWLTIATIGCFGSLSRLISGYVAVYVGDFLVKKLLTGIATSDCVAVYSIAGKS